jgi:outer membrane receptor protein involved in Fe transport
MAIVRKSTPVACAIFAAAPAAMAQQSNEGLEEIVVTAQKRSESVQDVPLNIQAFTTERLEELNVSGFEDYVKFLPSVSYSSAGPGFSQVYMRGVVSGGDGNHSGSLPSVGMYLDEQPITTIQGSLDIHVYDIERVEALAGPQGTLYGASSQAGTIRIITNKPDPKAFKAGYDVEVNTVAHGEQGYTAEGFVNLPISDNAAVRMVGWYSHDAGYIDNTPGTVNFYNGTTASNDRYVKDDYNDIDTYGARAALKIDLNDNWSITPAIMGQKMDTNGVFRGDVTRDDMKVSHYFPEWSTDKWYQASLTVEGRFSSFDVIYAGAYLDRQDEVRSDYMDYATTYDAYYGAEGCWSCYFTDNDGNYISAGQHITGKDGYTKLSQEIRFASAGQGPLQWVLGGFYQRQTHDIDQNYLVDNLADSAAVSARWPDTLWLTKQDRVDEDQALFGQMTYTLWDKLDLTAGIRQFWSDNSIKGFFGFGADNIYGSSTGVNRCSNPDKPYATAPCKNLDGSTSDDGQTYRLNATYHFDADRMAYATYSTGFRPGGVNRRSEYANYKPDYLDNYELGWKTSWAGNRVRFNGALFHEKWSDFQYSFLGTNSFTIVQNAPSATIDGLESDVNWAATDSLLLSGGFSWLFKAELDAMYCQSLDENLRPVKTCADPAAPKGQELPVTPEFKANLTARYTFQLAGNDSFVQAAGVYEGSRWAALETLDRGVLGKIDSYTLVDLSAGMQKGPYSFEIYIDNVFDSTGEIARGVEALVSLSPPVYGYPSRPRTIGIKFGQSF